VPMRAPFAALFAILLGYVLSLALRPVSDSHVWLDGWGVAGFELLASVLIILRGIVDRPARSYVFFIGLGGCAWALGDFVNTYMSVHGENPGSPALFNFLWAGFFLLAYAGLMRLMDRDVIRITAANYLDGLLLLLVSSAAMIAFLFAAIHHAAGGDAATVATNLVYPALDMPLLVLMLFGIALSPPARRLRWYLLAAAGTANLVGDCVAVFPTVAGGHFGNLLNAAAWPTSLLLIAAAFWLAPGSGRPARENNHSGFMVPTVASVLAVVILFVGIVSDINRVGMAVALLALIVSGARFGLALRHSRMLTEQREQELHAAARMEHDARDALETAAAELRARSERDVFGKELNEALEMVQGEHGAYDVVERAIMEISDDAPVELLLAESSRAHLQRVASSPVAGPPGCPVSTPFACVAVRRGQPVAFGSSEALNACPMLRNRGSGPCSAVCVPVGFMGRALGVLHATGPVGSPATGEQIDKMATLATQAGARIGTLRAFERTERQASTDALTGLINRRTLEDKIHDLLSEGVPFALAAGDLDKFKAINDTYGHEVGDRALRLFSRVASTAIRDDDLLARWGGEEFTVILPRIDRHEAVAVLDRIRHALAAAHSGGQPTFTVSFGVTDTSIGGSMERLLQVADTALYRSKQRGRDRVTVADGFDADDTAKEALGGELAGANGHGGGPARRSDAKAAARKRAVNGNGSANGRPPAAGARTGAGGGAKA
jgi:diguanylate cyclase (GGDEF)-like protein